MKSEDFIMLNKVINTCNKFNMISNGDSILVGLSGGADSVSLLYSLYLLKDKYNLTLYAAHVHHGIRGNEANSDLKFCENFCKRLNVKFFFFFFYIPSLAKKRKQSLELCGREERYKFFEEIKTKYNTKIATAHTASDNIETLFLNLARGACLKGASGIPPVRDNIIRPLIECSREEIEKFCADNNLCYVTDSTNLEDDYSRNKIRHNVVPVLKQINPNLEDAILRFTQSIACVENTVKEQAELLLKSASARYGYSQNMLLKANRTLLSEAICILLRENEIEPSYKKIDKIISILREKKGIVELNRNVFAFCNGDNFDILNKAKKLDIKNVNYNISEDFPGTLVVRSRKTGDIFNVNNKRWGRTLNKAMMDAKYPAELRDYTLCLCDNNIVLWCEPLGYSKEGEEYREKYDLKCHYTTDFF